MKHLIIVILLLTLCYSLDLSSIEIEIVEAWVQSQCRAYTYHYDMSDYNIYLPISLDKPILHNTFELCILCGNGTILAIYRSNDLGTNKIIVMKKYQFNHKYGLPMISKGFGNGYFDDVTIGYHMIPSYIVSECQQ